jgi:fructose 1,6-bisphosphate aldolase/phosphatase
VAPTSRLSLIACRYVGKDDPIMIVRSFAFPHLVAGWMRGSHNGPLMPTAVSDRDPGPLRRPAPGRGDGLPPCERQAGRPA